MPGDTLLCKDKEARILGGVWPQHAQTRTPDQRMNVCTGSSEQVHDLVLGSDCSNHTGHDGRPLNIIVECECTACKRACRGRDELPVFNLEVCVCVVCVYGGSVVHERTHVLDAESPPTLPQHQTT